MAGMEMKGDALSAPFEENRKYLTGLAYRMVGSVSAAEDIVQDAFLRWQGADRVQVREPKAFLTRVVTRLCLDHLRTARTQREIYVGPWLPEPVLDTAFVTPESESERAEDLSVALMLALERLSPLERAAFLLRDVFDTDYVEISAQLDRSEAACRQLVTRARAHVHHAKPRYEVSREEGKRLADAFMEAAKSGDTVRLTGLLKEDAMLHSDGGGQVRTALNVISGADRIGRFFIGIIRKQGSRWGERLRFERINGLPGFVMQASDGHKQTMAFEISDGKISALYIVRNPEKLRHIEV